MIANRVPSGLGDDRVAPLSTPVERDSSGVRFADDVVELGEQPWNCAVPFSLCLMNPTRIATEIVAVQSSCGCTTLGLPALPIALAAGGQLEINGALHTTLKIGAVEHTVTAHTRDGAMAASRLRLSTVPRYVFTPERIDFGEQNVVSGSGVAKICAFASQKAALIDWRSDAPWLSASFLGREHGYDIVISLDPRRLEYGTSTGRLAVITTDDLRPEFTILVTARGVAAIRPVPAIVVLRDSEEQVVQFLGNDGESVIIERIESSHPVILASIDRGEVRVTAKAVISESAWVEVVDSKGVR